MPGCPLQQREQQAIAKPLASLSDVQPSRLQPGPAFPSKFVASQQPATLNDTRPLSAPATQQRPADDAVIFRWGQHARRSQHARPRRPQGSWGIEFLIAETSTVQSTSPAPEAEYASEAAAAELLLGIGMLGGHSGSPAHSEQHRKKARTASYSPEPSASWQGAAPLNKASQPYTLPDNSSWQGSQPGAPPQFQCVCCRKSVALRGEKRPTFFCAHCPSKAGNQKRAQRALLAGDSLGRTVTVTEAATLLRDHSSSFEEPGTDKAAQNSSSRRLSKRTTSSAGLPLSTAGRGISLPSALSGEAALASGGSLQADQDEHQGRCKCGKRISAAHPPCKSELMLLCEKFQQRYCQMGPNGASTPILLNDVAGDLGVPRRRLYDIINVMEAVEIVHRIGKLAYEWRGTAHLPALLEQLLQDEEQGRPVEDRVRKSGQHAKQAATAAQHAAATLQNQASIGSQEEGRQTSNSLWVLSRKFVRLLLANPGPVPLTEAAALLAGHDSGDPRRQQMLITIERRLIDIGCILSCVDLIEKTYLGKRQPAFTWNWRWQRSGSLSSIGSSITCFMLAKEESSPCADLAAHGGETIGTGPGLDPSDVAQELPVGATLGASAAVSAVLVEQAGGSPAEGVLPDAAGRGSQAAVSHGSAVPLLEIPPAKFGSKSSSKQAGRSYSMPISGAQLAASQGQPHNGTAHSCLSGQPLPASFPASSLAAPVPADPVAFNAWLRTALAQSACADQAAPAGSSMPSEPSIRADSAAASQQDGNAKEGRTNPSTSIPTCSAPSADPAQPCSVPSMSMATALQVLQLQQALNGGLAAGFGASQGPAAHPLISPWAGAQLGQLPWPFGLQLHHASLAMTLQLMQQRGQLGLPSLAAIKGLNLLPGADAGAGAAGPGLPPGLLASLMLGTGLSTMPGVPLQSSEHSVRSQAAAHSTVQPHSVTVTSAVQQAAE